MSAVPLAFDRDTAHPSVVHSLARAHVTEISGRPRDDLGPGGRRRARRRKKENVVLCSSMGFTPAIVPRPVRLLARSLKFRVRVLFPELVLARGRSRTPKQGRIKNHFLAAVSLWDPGELLGARFLHSAGVIDADINGTLAASRRLSTTGCPTPPVHPAVRARCRDRKIRLVWGAARTYLQADVVNDGRRSSAVLSRVAASSWPRGSALMGNRSTRDHNSG